MKDQLKYKGVPIPSYIVDGIQVNFKDPSAFGRNQGMIGLHTYAPSHSELARTIEDAQNRGHTTVYVYGFIRNEHEGLGD